MSELQVKITLGELDVFLQGDGDLVYKIFSDIRENGIGKLGKISLTEKEEAPVVAKSKMQHREIVEDVGQASQVATKARKKTQQNTAQLLKDLDLSERNGAEKSLKDFVGEKNPSSNVQKTAVFVYYLEKFMNVEEITIDHIFTCYKNMGYRVPNNLQQNLTDTCSSKYGYISRKDGKYSMTVLGDNYIEFDINEGE